MKKQESLDPPEETLIDAAYEGMLAAADIPTFGFASFLIPKLFKAPVAKRVNEWMAHVAQSIEELRLERGIDVDALVEDPQFQTTVFQASQAAIRTHNEEKRAALRNAILNAALPGSPDETQQHLFIQWVDELTALHLKVLNYCLHSKLPERKREEVIERLFPESKPLAIASVILRDLISRNLIEPEPDTGVVVYEEQGIRITSLGSAFLSFIRHPLAGDDQLTNTPERDSSRVP